MHQVLCLFQPHRVEQQSISFTLPPLKADRLHLITWQKTLNAAGNENFAKYTDKMLFKLKKL